MYVKIVYEMLFLVKSYKIFRPDENFRLCMTDKFNIDKIDRA